MVKRSIFLFSMCAVMVCGSIPVWSQNSGGFPFGGGGGGDNPIQNVVPPPGSSFNFSIDANRSVNYTYEGPEKFDQPIRIWFKAEDRYDPKRKPDLYVWADEIHWHSGIQSGTAAGRVIVDNSTEYRIETTYVEYDHKIRQIYCPRQVKIIQRLPDGPDNLIVAESALVTLDENGIKSARVDRFLDTEFRPTDQVPTNPFKKEGRENRIQSPKAEPKKEIVPALPERRRRQIAPPVSYETSSSDRRSAKAP